MKRRNFLAYSAAAASYFALNSYFKNSRLKVGVVSSLFNFSGYSKTKLSSLVEYESHKKAYQDLKDGKIDALISSATFLGALKPEFSLFGSSLGAENKDEWIKKNYEIIQAYHAQNEIHSSYLGLMSPLMVRISNVSLSRLAEREDHASKVIIGANGVRKVWFDHLGYHVNNHNNSLRLSAQVAQVASTANILNVTDAFPPTLFLRVIKQNNEIGVLTKFTPGSFLILDNVTKSPVPIELHYKKEKESETLSLQKLLREAVANDSDYQQAALKVLQEQTGLDVVQTFPLFLKAELQKCQEAYLQFLSTQSSTASELINSFKLNGMA